MAKKVFDTLIIIEKSCELPMYICHCIPVNSGHCGRTLAYSVKIQHFPQICFNNS